MKTAHENNQYIIPFASLSIDEHVFNFSINDTFFKELEYSDIQHANLSVQITLNKQHAAMFTLNIQIKGFVETLCDRCAEDFNMPIDTQRMLVFKTGGTEHIEEEEIIYLPSSEHEIDLTHHLYESVILAMPLKRVHPDDAAGNSTCNPEVMKKLNELSVSEETTSDPRWAALKNIKIN